MQGFADSARTLDHGAQVFHNTSAATDLKQVAAENGVIRQQRIQIIGLYAVRIAQRDAGNRSQQIIHIRIGAEFKGFAIVIHRQ